MRQCSAEFEHSAKTILVLKLQIGLQGAEATMLELDAVEQMASVLHELAETVCSHERVSSLVQAMD
jgi:hypothetical protein